MPEARITETHERKAVRLFDRHELARILADLVAAEVGMPTGQRDDVKVEVRFEDQTEGSPAYKVGTRAVVTVTQTLPTKTTGLARET